MNGQIEIVTCPASRVNTAAALFSGQTALPEAFLQLLRQTENAQKLFPDVLGCHRGETGKDGGGQGRGYNAEECRRRIGGDGAKGTNAAAGDIRIRPTYAHTAGPSFARSHSGYDYGKTGGAGCRAGRDGNRNRSIPAVRRHFGANV